MKVSNIFKYIFIIFAIAIIIYAGYRIYNTNTDNNQIEESKVIEEQEIVKDIRIAVTNYDSMNPLITNNKEILNIDTLIFEPLFTLTQNYELRPCLAKECSKTGDNTYVVKLNNNILWQDDTEFTAYDIQYTINTIKAGNSVYKYNVEYIENVEVIDKNTIKLTLVGNIPFFEYYLVFPIMPSAYYLNENFYETEKIPIGTGQFKISNISSSSITLVKNELWRDIKENNSKIETITIKLYSSMGEAYNSFKIGNVDLLNTTNPNFQDYIGTIGFNKTEYAGREFDFLALNCENTILKEKEVRQAISYAIDKDNIVSSIFSNQYLTAEYPLDYGNYLYEANEVSSGYNAQQAKKVLEENGWTYKSNRWRKNIDVTTQKLKIKISVQKENNTRVQVAELIKEQLEEIGIEVTIEKISQEQYDNYINNKNYQVLLTGVYTSYIPDLTYYFGRGNLENYANENMQELINSVSIIKDSAELKERYKKIYSIYKEDVPFIGLYRNKNITITSQDLIGTIKPNTYTSFYDISLWYRK